MTFKDRFKVTNPSGLVQQPHDPYWDGPISRRETQMAVNDICRNEAELMARSDTSYIVTNFLCEKLGVTRGEIDAYVEKKKAEMAALKTLSESQQNTTQPEATGAKSDS